MRPGPGEAPSNVSTVPSRSKRTTGALSPAVRAVESLVFVSLMAGVLWQVRPDFVDGGRGTRGTLRSPRAHPRRSRVTLIARVSRHARVLHLPRGRQGRRFRAFASGLRRRTAGSGRPTL